MEKNILILSDFVGYGNVAMATSRAVLTKMGCTVFCLPTALISNTWNFGSCAVQSTTDYLKEALENWNRLGFRLDAVLIGYIADEPQAQWLAEQCTRWKADGTRIFLDPIFADNGKLYRGIGQERIEFLRRLLPLTDFVLPNCTEACFLANASGPATALDSLAALGAKGALITGANGEIFLLEAGEKGVIPYAPVPGNFPGAGDAFTALFAGGILAGQSPQSSVRQAADTTRQWILRSLEENWQGMGLPVERYL